MLITVARVKALSGPGGLSPEEINAVTTELTVLADAAYTPIPEPPANLANPEARRRYKSRLARVQEINRTPSRGSVERLRRRIPALAALAKTKAVRPEVFEALLSTIEPELALLRDPGYERPRAEKTEAVKLAGRVESLLEAILPKVVIGPPELAASRDWRRIQVAWRLTGRYLLAANTVAQRSAADKWLKLVAPSADRLAVAKLLDPTEVALLKMEARHLSEELYEFPPIDRMVTYCAMFPWYHPRRSLTRLNARLELLRRLTAAGKVRREVVAKAIPNLKADLKTLTEHEGVKSLTAAERAEANATRAAAKAMILRIEAQLQTSAP